MGYDLNGKKVLLSVNVTKYPGFNRDRNGSEADERNIINTFKVYTGSKSGSQGLEHNHHVHSSD